MARETIIIGCKLPNGLLLRHPDPKSTEEVRLNGLNSLGEKIIHAGAFATTEVDAEFWATWKLSYSTFQLLRNGSIFEAKNETDAKAKGKELAKEKTGLEPIDPKAHGVEKAV